MTNCPDCFELIGPDGICAGCGKLCTPEAEEEARIRHEEAARRIEALHGVKPVLPLGDLWGPDGNAWVIFARATKALKLMGVSNRVIQVASENFLKGTYESNLRWLEQFFRLDISGYDDLEHFLDDYEHGSDLSSHRDISVDDDEELVTLRALGVDLERKISEALGE